MNPDEQPPQQDPPLLFDHATGFVGQSGNFVPPPPSRLSQLNLRLLAVVVGGVIVLVAAVVVFVMTRDRSLYTYVGGKFSVSAPKGYEIMAEGENAEQEGVSFSEQDDESSQSKVLVFVQQAAKDVEGADKEDVLSAAEDLFTTALEEEGGGEGNTLEDSQTEDATINKIPVHVITANIKDGDAVAGKAKIIVGISGGSVYFVGVLAHDSDQELIKNTDKILNSFKLK